MNDGKKKEKAAFTGENPEASASTPAPKDKPEDSDTIHIGPNHPEDK